MSSRHLLSVVVVIAVVFATVKPLFAGPPPTLVKPVTDVYYGTKVIDPYRWMENLKDPAVATWFRSQANYTNSILATIPGRAALLADMNKLENSTTFVTDLDVDGDYIFYEKRLPQDDNYKLYVRQGLRGVERLLIDPQKLTLNGVHTSLDYFAPSLDGKYVAYALSPGGSENSTLFVLETDTGIKLSEAITRTQFGGVNWLPDNKSFFYTRLQKLKPGQDTADKESDSTAFLHHLGDDPDTQDIAVLSKAVTPTIPYEDIDVPSIGYTPGATDYIFAMDGRGVQSEVALYIAPLSSLSSTSATIPWARVCDFSDDVTGYDADDGKLFLLSHKNASHYKVLEVNLADARIGNATTLVFPGKTVITGLGAASDALYIHGRNGAVGCLLRIPYSHPEVQPISMPVVGALDPGIITDERYPGLLFTTESGTKPPTIYRYNAVTGRVSDTRLQPSVPIDFSHVLQIETQAKAPDGTMIPLSILAPKGIKLDGTHPTLLDGYGAYGDVDDLHFSPRILAWINRGGIYAVAHVRGGGEEGEDWYRAGFQATKPNTWRDFIACGQYLVDHKYTSPAHLAGEGTSAGGILISRAITDKPSLWGAALIRVGVSNSLRMEFTPNGPDNTPEFGSLTTEAGFHALYAMDGYQHVRNGVKYPAVMLTTGINDPRVASYIPAKMTARLQAAEASLPIGERRPVLLRVDYDAGHGVGSTKLQTSRDLADEWSFLLWQLGDPAFQPKD